MHLLRPGVLHLQACPTHVDRHAVRHRPCILRPSPLSSCRASQRPSSSSSADDEANAIRRQLEAYSSPPSDDSPDTSPVGDTTSSSSSDSTTPATPPSFSADNLKGSSGYSTQSIPPSLLSGPGSANDSQPSSAGGSEESWSSSSSAPTPKQPSIDLDSADMGSSGMDLAMEFSKLAQARSNRSGKNGRASNPADDMLAFNLIPSTPTSDAEAYMSDDEPLFDLPASSDTSDDEEGSSNSIQEGLAEVVNMEVRLSPITRMKGFAPTCRISGPHGLSSQISCY